MWWQMERRGTGNQLLGTLELEIMELMWVGGGPMTVRDLLEQINESRDPKLAYTTVMTVASRLAEKGALHRRREGRGYLYETAASDQAGLAVRNVLRDFGEEAVAHFVEEARGDPDTLRRLRRLLAEDS